MPRGQLRRAGARPGALDEVGEAELGEHLAVAGRRQVDRQLDGELGARRRAGVERDRHPHRQARRRAARRRGLGVDVGAHRADVLAAGRG